jgi:hypothetical protein
VLQPSAMLLWLPPHLLFLVLLPCRESVWDGGGRLCVCHYVPVSHPFQREEMWQLLTMHFHTES